MSIHRSLVVMIMLMMLMPLAGIRAQEAQYQPLPINIGESTVTEICNASETPQLYTFNGQAGEKVDLMLYGPAVYMPRFGFVDIQTQDMTEPDIFDRGDTRFVESYELPYSGLHAILLIPQQNPGFENLCADIRLAFDYALLPEAVELLERYELLYARSMQGYDTRTTATKDWIARQRGTDIDVNSFVDSGYQDIQPAVSPDGKLLAYATVRDHNGFTGEVFASTIEVGEFRTGTRLLSTQTLMKGIAGSPHFSPDSHRVVFHNTASGNYEIYSIGINDDGGNTLVQLTDDEADDFQPVYAPDGSQIAFVSNRSGKYEIYLMNADGSNVRQLTDIADGDVYRPQWSPNGSQFLFYVNAGETSEIYGMNADGTNVTQLTSNDIPEYDPTWTPDGLYIAYHSFAVNPTAAVIYMVSVDGGVPLQVTSSIYHSWQVAFVPTAEQQAAGQELAQAAEQQLAQEAEAAAVAEQEAAGIITVDAALLENPVTRNADWTPLVRTVVNAEMVLVPAGCFMMGSSEEQAGYVVALGGEPEWYVDEQPVHEQCFDAPFWIDRYEVSNAQYKQVGGNAPEGYLTGDDQPRDTVTWYDANLFCARRGARLPTEAEWEYAVRGPDSFRYPWGDDWSGRYATFAANAGDASTPVGSKPDGASWVGAMDMSGNLWEWTSTIYQAYPYVRNSQTENDNDTTSARLLRGGSWYNGAGDMHGANRIWREPTLAAFDFGIRCVRAYR